MSNDKLCKKCKKEFEYSFMVNDQGRCHVCQALNDADIPPKPEEQIEILKEQAKVATANVELKKLEREQDKNRKSFGLRSGTYRPGYCY